MEKIEFEKGIHTWRRRRFYSVTLVKILEKLFGFLDHFIPIPHQYKHAVLAAHLGKRWKFREIDWNDWEKGKLPEQDRILKRDKGNFDLKKGEKK